MLKKYLINDGVTSVGYTHIDDTVSDIINLKNAISLVLKLPKECIQAILDDDYKTYWKLFHQKVDEITEISLKTEKLIKQNGYNAFALTLKRNKCDMEKLLSRLPYKTPATLSGLGWIGRSALFVTRDYGSAVVLSTILTDLPLAYDSSIVDSYCDECDNCQKACPVDAINSQKWNSKSVRSDIIDIEKCFDYVKKQVKSGLGCSKCLAQCKLTQEYLKR